MYLRYGLREHRGTLAQSLGTIRYISYEDFRNLLDRYKYYAFDDRCMQIMFIARLHTTEEPLWLFIEICDILKD